MSSRVFCSYALPPEVSAELSRECDLRWWSGPAHPKAAELQEAVSSCTGLICLLMDSIDQDLLDVCPDLQWVSSVSVGVDHVDVSALSRRGIPLGNTPGVLVDTTADLAFALLLAAARRVGEGERFLRAGLWLPDERWSPDMFVGKDISGATLGIVGLGAIGSAVARRAQGFGMRVLGWSRSNREVAGVENVELDDLLRQSDFVSVHVALNDDTRDLISARELSRMKPGSVLVNTARGGIVNERALVDALRSRQLAAAGIDVYETEPIVPDHPLLSLENAVLVPHIGSASSSTRRRMVELAIANGLAAVRGEVMPHCVNPEVYEAGK